MPEPTPERRRSERRASGERSGPQRAADHAAIDRLAGDLLPALVAKLGATGLGEIEIREGPWKVRLRRPGLGPNLGRRATDRPSRAQPGHAGHGHAPGGLEGHRPARSAGAAVAGAARSTNGTGPPGAPSPVPGQASAQDEGGRRRDDADLHRIVATSPAVGIFRPRKEIKGGSRVRSGDPLAVVDVLGIPQEVVAPIDGVVGASLVEAGEAVEYGQELIVIELVTAPAAGPAADTGSGPASG
ncbi:MAG: biotin/lipoyl-containing protein [Chloroflexota bacterium]